MPLSSYDLFPISSSIKDRLIYRLTNYTTLWWQLMKKLCAVLISAAFYLTLTNAQASSYIVDEIDFGEGLEIVNTLQLSGTSWWHHSLDLTGISLDSIVSATLSIIAGGVDTNEVFLQFEGNNLGYLNVGDANNRTTTIFNLNSSWLSEGFLSNETTALNIMDGQSATIYSSILTIEVPEPGTISLLLLALLGFVYITKRQQINL